jgi:hypothetical protein
MNSLEPEDRKSESEEEDDSPQGPNLVLLYSLIALAILLATACAAMIVWPFYQQARH